jgi:hypothetical protein
MLDGKAAVFISGSELYKASVAYGFRDLIDSLGMRPVIVSDAPKLVGTWTPEEKVEAYLDRADVFLALCTPDDHLNDASWQTRQNVIDEVRSARTRPHLKDRICILKEQTVRLPSNLSAVYDRLVLDDLRGGFEAFLGQIALWGFSVEIGQSAKELPRTQAQPLRPNVVEGLRADDLASTQGHVRGILRNMPKPGQHTYIAQVVDVVRNGANWEERASAAHILEAAVEIDASLVPTDLLDDLSRHADFSVRSSVAVILFLLACTNPGSVPLDLVSRLASSSTEDWYVFTPAWNAAKQMALSRPEAFALFDELSLSELQQDREYAATALEEIAAVNPAIVPLEIVARLVHDEEPTVVQFARKAERLVALSSATARRHPYSPFTPF